MALLKTYSVASDITAQAVDCGALHDELASSGHVTNLANVALFGADELRVYGDSFVSESGCDTVVLNHSGEDPTELVIQQAFPYQHSEQVIKQTDVTLLGMDQEAWDYSRGARTTRDYKINAVLAVQHVYTYTMTNGNRDISTVTHTFNWYQKDGSIGLSKVTNKQMTAKALGELNREVRIGRMTDLRENAKLIGKQYITDDLYSWYGAEISSYEEIGSLDFENAVKNETDPTRTARLTEVIPEFGGLTVEQLLIWQFIGAYSWP